MNKIKALWELMRLEHGVMLALGIIIGSLIASQDTAALSVKNVILIFFTALFLEASTFALNDYFDLSIDTKNNRTDRPLVRGDLLPRTAIVIFIILFPAGIASSYFVNFTCFTIALITAIFAVFYDVFLKKIKLLGNFYIAYVMAIPFVFGAAAVQADGSTISSIHPAVVIIALIAFFTGSGREIMKDVMDFEGDTVSGVKSFPTYIGTRKANALAAFFFIPAVILSFLPFFSQDYSLYYKDYVFVGLILITDFLLLYTSFQLLSSKDINMKATRMFTLLAIFIGLLAFFLGAYI
jgi:geranylgeranylglycerol-phosphate geranylgeranyltransferase